MRRHLEIMTGAGIVAGVVYWMIAGRNAGAWREPPRPLQPPPPLPANSTQRPPPVVSQAVLASHPERVNLSIVDPPRLNRAP